MSHREPAIRTRAQSGDHEPQQHPPGARVRIRDGDLAAWLEIRHDSSGAVIELFREPDRSLPYRRLQLGEATAQWLAAKLVNPD